MEIVRRSKIALLKLNSKIRDSVLNNAFPFIIQKVNDKFWTSFKLKKYSKSELDMGVSEA